LVAKIVAELEPSAVVTWNDHIEGAKSRRARQIDVSIRRSDPEFLGIIDAKHYLRPATIDRIDALTGVMRDVGANYGALVCSAGFSRTMHAYARNVGVSLFNAHDAQSLNWSSELMIPILWTELTPAVTLSGEFEFQAGDTLDTADPLGIRVTADDGLTVLNPLTSFERHWNGPAAPRTVGVAHRLTHNEPVRAIVEDAEGNRQLRPAHNFGFTYVVEPKTWLGRFQPSECRGLIDYLEGGVFIASHLPADQIPIRRDAAWPPIMDLNKLGVVPKGSIVLAMTPVVISDLTMEDLKIERIGPLPS
jgi:hypothetical protein